MKRLRDRRGPRWLLAGTAAYIGLVCVVDFLLPPPVDVWVLYLPLILLLTRLDAPVLIIAATIACTLLMTVDILLQEYELGVPFILLILGTRFVALWLVAFSGVILVRSTQRRKELEREVLEAAANEQQRIGQELHDSVGQELTGLGFMVNALAERLRENVAETQIVSRLSVGIIGLQQHIRTLSHGLIPVPVVGKGLFTALKDLAHDTTEKSGIPVHFSSPQQIELSDHTAATHLYRIAQEAVNNALRHGNPKRIDVSLRSDNSYLTLAVADDGRGMNYPPAEANGMGFRIMRYRAEQIGGVLHLRGRDGGGTEVACTLPKIEWRNSPDDELVTANEGANIDR